MTQPFNPLLDRHKTVKELNASDDAPNIELLASENPPLSPSTGQPMEYALCRDVPVWFCASSRLVVPFKKAS